MRVDIDRRLVALYKFRSTGGFAALYSAVDFQTVENNDKGESEMDIEPQASSTAAPSALTGTTDMWTETVAAMAAAASTHAGTTGPEHQGSSSSSSSSCRGTGGAATMVSTTYGDVVSLEHQYRGEFR